MKRFANRHPGMSILVLFLWGEGRDLSSSTRPSDFGRGCVE